MYHLSYQEHVKDYKCNSNSSNLFRTIGDKLYKETKIDYKDFSLPSFVCEKLMMEAGSLSDMSSKKILRLLNPSPFFSVFILN